MKLFFRGLQTAVITGAVSLFLGLPASLMGQGMTSGGGGGVSGGAGGGAGGIGGGVGSGGGGGTSGLAGGGGGLGGGGLGGGGLGAGGGGARSTGNTSGLGTGTTSGAGGPSASNFLGQYYKYPYVTALGATNTNQSAQTTTYLQSNVSNTTSAYGSATFRTTTTGTTTGRTGAAGRTATSSRNLGTGTSNLTINGFSTMATTNSMNVAMPHYASQIKFNIPSRPAAELQAELKSAILNSQFAPSAQKVSVQVDGRTVTLKGEVSSEDERRHIESLVATTPGVRQIRSELTLKP